MLRDLGVLEKILSRAIQPRDVNLRSYKTGSLLYSLNLDPYTEHTYGLPLLVIHRADLCQVLHEEAERLGAIFRFGCLTSSVCFSTPAAQVSTGQAVSADLVVGADGLGSICREKLMGHADPLRQNGRLVYRILIGKDKMAIHPELTDMISAPSIDVWAGPEAHIVCYPVKDHYNVVMFFPDHGTQKLKGPQPADIGYVRTLIYDWEPRVKQLLDIAESSLMWSLLEMNELDCWVHQYGRFTLLGDAAHACLPFL